MGKDFIANCHLLPLSIDSDDINEESDSDISSIDSDISSIDSDISSIDSDIEVNDTELVNDDFIRLNLSNNEHGSEDEPENLSDSNNNEEIICLNQSSTSSTSKTKIVATEHKRRQRNFAEKLKIISEFNKGASLHALEFKYKCTRKMIREWKKNENQLIKVVKDKGGKGKKRKRLDGAGAKLVYCDLDEHLIKWYRSKRGEDQEDINVRKDKVTFKDRLSLQKPVRKQKISLPEAHLLIENFHSFVRRSGQFGPRRGVMGCFVESDICNMDESPLNLWGDQSNRCINDINTKNEIEGHLDDKRFATVILCVFPEGNDRVKPVLLFKGTGRVAAAEEKQYARGVKGVFTPKAVINISAMNIIYGLVV
ncbi:unnamed protein product [Rotaria socialis]|uniref:Uncharacterized protein n=1 Tax=Rotaria socialis TaxID=392032 RepID=A0A821GN98_9BILA|nr:unnamed protein product [Rotaria socialis]CAF4673173.1 unnamed protein product [Rotaria socialis]